MAHVSLGPKLRYLLYKGSFFLYPTFFFLHPHNVMQRRNCPNYFLKTLKCTWTVFIFLHYGLWNPEKFRIGTSSKISNPPIHNLKYAFHLQKSTIQKKHFGSINPQQKYVFWIQKSVIKKKHSGFTNP